MIARNQQQQQQQQQQQHRITPQQRPFQSRGLLSPNFSDSDTVSSFLSFICLFIVFCRVIDKINQC
jgi:hypothetical protein